MPALVWLLNWENKNKKRYSKILESVTCAQETKGPFGKQETLLKSSLKEREIQSMTERDLCEGKTQKEKHSRKERYCRTIKSETELMKLIPMVTQITIIPSQETRFKINRIKVRISYKTTNRCCNQHIQHQIILGKKISTK